MPIFHDQLNREIDIPFPPQRIISLVPSQTELLFNLGLDKFIKGVTRFCIHPAEKVKHLCKVGGTKQVDMQLIAELQPDLIIANKEENERSSIEALMNSYPVWISDIHNLEEALGMITGIGELTDCSARAQSLAATIKGEFSKILTLKQTLTAVYLIWRKPYMAAGAETFIHQMLSCCGLTNAITRSRYPEVNLTTLQQINPQVILLSSEPYPFKQKHQEELQAVLPESKIILVDGEMFSWYGSRLQYAPAYFNKLVQAMQY